MKGGLAVMLDLAGAVREPDVDVTWCFYACEEVGRQESGFTQLWETRPEFLAGDAAILGEPTDGFVEAGCQGTMRVVIHLGGLRAHTARPFTGNNAIHRLVPVLTGITEWEGRTVVLDGCEYVEQFQAVAVDGGIAGNVVPDHASVTVNYRFAPDRDRQPPRASSLASSTACSTTSSATAGRSSTRPTGPRPASTTRCSPPSSPAAGNRRGRRSAGRTSLRSGHTVSRPPTSGPATRCWTTPRRACRPGLARAHPGRLAAVLTEPLWRSPEHPGRPDLVRRRSASDRPARGPGAERLVRSESSVEKEGGPTGRRGGGQPMGPPEVPPLRFPPNHPPSGAVDALDEELRLFLLLSPLSSRD